jgi:hypothetical protein
MILAIYLVPHGTAEVLQFGKTIAEDTGMSGYQKREARQHTASARHRSGDSEIS